MNLSRYMSLKQITTLYFPDKSLKAGYRVFSRWVRNNESLRRRLEEAGVKKGDRIYPPRAVEIIFEEFGEP